ncbi:DUF885 family protein [Sphingomonas sanxanigenens]|uniref:DUF885 domain-containing protein n=1 Tax=Sphingomonas sanxanigenens DSM 19645 = NX02 TaxID=1123269 RepID=W0AAA7_9SPHN|nr:DUF885 family protein [Sphingomonas sanxanigenens]AHE54011.1 hypothetical protein NX02_11500 [Sphingomonas sanxanigenens DSM 19645 = NX02]
MLRGALILIASTVLAAAPAAAQPAVQALGADFWAWRAKTQPASSDDIPRIERPKAWVPDWSRAAVKAQRAALAAFEARWKALAGAPRSVPETVDYRLLGSAFARVHWELDAVAAWRRQPHFYVAQALNPIFELLLPPPPVARDRIDGVIRLLEAAPATLAAGRANLDDMRGPFVDVALGQLAQVPESLTGMAAGLKPFADAGQRRRLDAAVAKAIPAFAAFADDLRARRAGLSEQTAVGEAGYRYFLGEVALYPYTPEQLLVMGRQEWTRAVQFEEVERNRNRSVPDLPIGASLDAVIGKLDADELAVRRFLADQRLLTISDWAGHYRGRGFPAYLAPIGWLGRTFDFTGPSRLGQDATVYLPEPSPKLGYFNLSITRDPRPIIVHEGVPGHYFQLAMSWANPNRLRRHYYDSAANEGTGFYAEEMMLQAGLWADSPRSREIVYNFARLRALRVEVDVKLALGQFTIAQAADYLEAMVPMDRATAEEEAVFFAAAPGQAISYQIGKLQTLEFLAEARVREGKAFDLRRFHDYLWQNGNVPIALLKQEYLSMTAEQ